ncbi:hypothetical protein SAMN05216374_2772 [Tardiphaga sp. OK246]|nr:hypothetical protein SAMN05216374_2772 [Tardiphaga sp. OK246]
MTTTKVILKTILGSGALAVGLLAGDPASVTVRSSFVSSAEAVIGRPLTPLSYAGVARRTTRRAVAVGAAAGAAAAVAPVVVAPARTCVQAVDAYGRLYWRCP